MTLGKLIVEMGLDLRDFDRNLQTAQQRVQNVGRGFTSVGTRLTAGLTAPIAGFGVYALRSAANFQTGMLRVQALTNASADMMKRLEDQAKELGATTQYTAGQAADAMGFLAMAGFEAEEILGAMPSTLQLAASAQIDLARAADITTNIMTGYGKTVADLPRVNDILVKAFTSANVNLEMLAESMKYAGPIAHSAGLQFEEAAALIALMGNAGIQGSMAGTSLRGAIARLLSPTSAMQDILRRTNTAVLDNAGNMRSLIDIFRDLETAGISTADIMELFGLRAGPASAALLNMGTTAITDMVERLKDAGGTAQRVADVQMSGLLGVWRELVSAAEAVAIAFMEAGLTDMVQDLGKEITALLRWIGGWDQDTKLLVAKIALLTATLGPLLIGIGLFIGSVAKIMAVTKVVAGGLMALGTAAKLAAIDFAATKGAIAAMRVALNTLFLTSPLAMFALVAAALYVVYKASRLVYENWDRIRELAGRLRERIVNIWPEVKRSMRLLFPSFDLLIRNIERTKNAFKWLWDKVVGHSYVPDMVAAIKTEFAALKNVMTAVSVRQVDETVAAFAKLDGALPMIDRLRQRYETTVNSIRDLNLALLFERDADAIAQMRAEMQLLQREASGLATLLTRLQPLQDFENKLKVKPQIAMPTFDTGKDLLGRIRVTELELGFKRIADVTRKVVAARERELAVQRLAQLQQTNMQRVWWALQDDFEYGKEELKFGLLDLAQSMGPSALMFKFMQGVLDGLQPALEALLEPVAIIGEMVGNIIAPLLDITAKQLGFLAKIVSYVVQAIGWLIRALGKAINWLLPGNPANGLVKFGQNMIDQAKAARRAMDATNKATEATERMTASLSNVPSGYRLLQLRQYEASRPQYRKAVPVGGTTQTTNTTYQMGQGAIVVQAGNRPVRELVNEIEAELERRRRAMQGATA